MSFYGKFYQEMGNAFRNFLFGNKDKKGEAFPKDTNVVNDIMFEAGTSEDQGSVLSGNRWIQMAKPADGTTNGVEIYHGAPGGSTTTFSNISNIREFKTNEELKEKDKLIKDGKYLNFGYGVTFDSFTYDKAGHLVKTDSQEYVLPESPELNLGVILTNQVEELQEYVGLPLPQGEEQPKENILTRLDGLEETEEITMEMKAQVQGGFFGEGENKKEYPGLLNDVDALQEQMRAIQKDVGDVALMGIYSEERGIAEVFGNIWNLSTKSAWGDSATIVELIGNLDEMNTTATSLVEAINELAKSISTINVAIDGLEARVLALENS